MPMTPTHKNAPLGFELWDNESGNLMGDYDTEEEALAAIGEAVTIYGPDYAQAVTLLRVGPRGRLKRIATGADLVVSARESAAAGASRVAIESQPQGSPAVLIAQSER